MDGLCDTEDSGTDREITGISDKAFTGISNLVSELSGDWVGSLLSISLNINRYKG